MLLNLVYEASITLIPKSNKDTAIKKKNYTTVSLKKILNKILANLIQQHINEIIHHYGQVGVILGIQG
jgi:hypothetical protein